MSHACWRVDGRSTETAALSSHFFLTHAFILKAVPSNAFHSPYMQNRFFFFCSTSVQMKTYFYQYNQSMDTTSTLLISIFPLTVIKLEVKQVGAHQFLRLKHLRGMCGYITHATIKCVLLLAFTPLILYASSYNGHKIYYLPTCVLDFYFPVSLTYSALFFLSDFPMSLAPPEISYSE